ncbi:hypothetical protein BN1007_70549 [Klebsiella variicola]|nr:hypothetical protein KV8917_280181 [Klebsiella variicola]CTQ16368.1 hypothetical protein BN1007_70549 [Klebsiella variicola]CTQ25123.1 hypothetical protein BN1200_700027 [Klebsiella variicola]
MLKSINLINEYNNLLLKTIKSTIQLYINIIPPFSRKIMS